MTDVRRRPGRPPNEELQTHRRVEILDCAIKLFAERGFADADTQELANRLAIAKGTIYRYFPSKQDLFFAAVERGTQQLREWIAERAPLVEDGLAMMAKATEAALEFFELKPEIVELIVLERAHFKKRQSTFFARTDPDFECHWHTVLGRLMETGRLKSMPATKLMDLLGDMIFGTMFSNYFSGRPSDFREQAKAIVDVVFLGVLTDSERERWNAR